jgi:membrane protease YdiL (CAAX protease family)
MLPNIWFAIKHVLVGLVVMVAVTAPWSVIAVANVRLSPQVPWAIPVMVVYIGAVMAYLQGRGWPVSTAETRRRFFRARLANRTEFFWSLVAGALAVTCLWLLFAAAGKLAVQLPAGREAQLPAAVLLAFVIVSAAVTAIGEEAGLRGFMQTRLEWRFGPRVAIAVTAFVFVLIHATRGLPTLVRNGPWYLAVGIIYGVLAYLAQSILPVIVLHFLGDIVVFSLRSSLVSLSAPMTGMGKLVCLMIALVAAALNIAAFRRLAAVTISRRTVAGGGIFSRLRFATSEGPMQKFGVRRLGRRFGWG